MTDLPGGPFPDGVIVLAGGQGRRLGGVDKAALGVGGGSLLDRALAAAAGRPTVVVGPRRDLPAGAWPAREDPPGGGPAAGVAAGFPVLRRLLAGLPPDTGAGPGDPRDPGGRGAPDLDELLVAVLAVDQPGVTSSTLARLSAAVPRPGGLAAPPARGPSGAPASGPARDSGQESAGVPASESARGAVLVSGGRRQYTAGVFPCGALDAALRGRHSWHGVALRLLVDPLVGAEVPAEGEEASDVDTPRDLARWRALEPPPTPAGGPPGIGDTVG